MVKIAVIFLTLICASLSFNMRSAELPRPNDFGGNFSLPSTQGKELSIADWKGQVVLVNFGFTSCPDVCPMVLSKLALVQKKLGNKGEALQVVFVTVDPERDSIEKIKSYLNHFHEDFVGMRAPNETELAKLLKKYGGFVASSQTEQGAKELSHTDYVYVIDKQGYVAGFYDVKGSYQDLLKAVDKLLQGSSE